MIAVIFYLACMGSILSISMVIPLLIAFGMEEFDVGVKMSAYVMAWGFICTGVLLSITGRNRELNRLGGLYLCLIVWILFPAFIAFSIRDLLDISYIEAIFETYSAFTTNGASLIVNPDVIPRSVFAMLMILQWLGGITTLITVSVILAPSAVGGLQEESGNTIGKSLVTSPARLHKFCRNLMQTYITLTIACFVLLRLVGVTPFDSLILAMTALSTGGFGVGQNSVESMSGYGGMIITAFFLIIGATSIYWHRMLSFQQRRSLSGHWENYWLILLWVMLAMAFYSVIRSISFADVNSNQMHALSESIFNSASIISTSGLHSRPGVFSLLPPILVLTLLIMGGGSYSTSGGLKLYRIGGMLSHSWHELNRLIFPNIVRPSHFGGYAYDTGRMKAIWSFFVSTVLVIAVSSILLAVSGFNFQAAFTASIASFTTAGPAYDPHWNVAAVQGWPEYSEMNSLSHIILIILMLAGRLELVSFLVLFNISYWKSQ